MQTSLLERLWSKIHEFAKKIARPVSIKVAQNPLWCYKSRAKNGWRQMLELLGYQGWDTIQTLEMSKGYTCERAGITNS